MVFAFSYFSHTTSGTISPKTSGYSFFLQKQTQDISLLRIFQLSNTVLHPYQSVHCVCVSSQTDGSVCVCVCVCVCVHAHVCAHVCASFTCVDVYKSLKTFFISMYIMCIILCLFSALSRRVGALQTSIIIKKSHNYKS